MNVEHADLTGKRIIVVEDDFLLASDICQELRDVGATVLGPAPTPFYATQLIGNRKIDAAVLDIRLHGNTVFTFADLLHERGVPILFATGCAAEEIPVRFRQSPILSKPVDRQRLVRELVAATRSPGLSETRPLRAGTPLWEQGAALVFARALARRLPDQAGKR